MGTRLRGIFSFLGKRISPFDPQEKGIRLAVSDLNDSYASGMGMPGMRLYDPCCGTGTLLIEAAFRQEHRAPGLTRAFAMEQFSIFPAEPMRS